MIVIIMINGKMINNLFEDLNLIGNY